MERDDQIGARGRLAEASVAMNRGAAKPTPLERFLKSVGRTKGLSKKDRLRIVEQALLLLNMNYVHLPLKRAMHAVDPIQRLKLLRFRLLEMKESEMPSEVSFHKRLMEIFASTRDLHTLYLLPEPFKRRVAYLPFLIEQYFEKDRKGQRVEKFAITRIVDEFYRSVPDPPPSLRYFEPGVEVLYWNGVPIQRAIEINGESQAGSNIEARFARGLDNLTIRPLETSLPPDEAWVAITYRARTGEVLTLKQDWLIYTVGSAATQRASKASTKKRAAIDIKKTRINDVRRSLFAPRSLRVSRSFEHVFYAEVRRAGGRDLGYVRLFSFDVDDPEAFVTEFARVITSADFPQEGLIIDVRGNGGGKIRAGERLLQLFTPRRITPELFEFINTPLNLKICRLAPKHWHLSRWADSIAESVVTGATYSRGFPLNSDEACNDIGQVYHGPVLLITDALSYSTTDIFAAGFQDNEVGEILGTSDNTGAGGANVWWYQDLIDAVRHNPQSPFKPLPKGADILVAMRRSIRVGKHAGRPLEELGITPDHRHHMTRRDVLDRNQDLILAAARILDKKPRYSLSVNFHERNGSAAVTVSAGSWALPRDGSRKISRVDIYQDGRPLKSIDAARGQVRPKTITLNQRNNKTELRVEAFDGGGRLVASLKRRI